MEAHEVDRGEQQARVQGEFWRTRSSRASAKFDAILRGGAAGALRHAGGSAGREGRHERVHPRAPRALSPLIDAVIDLFKQWDATESGEIDKKEFRARSRRWASTFSPTSGDRQGVRRFDVDARREAEYKAGVIKLIGSGRDVKRARAEHVRGPGGRRASTNAALNAITLGAAEDLRSRRPRLVSVELAADSDKSVAGAAQGHRRQHRSHPRHRHLPRVG